MAKEIYIEIDESGTIDWSPKEIENYYFLLCCYISNNEDVKPSNNPFHYSSLMNNINIPPIKKIKVLKDMALKINQQNIFYFIKTIKKQDLPKDNYKNAATLLIQKEIVKFLKKITSKNNLKVNISYDHGQKILSVAIGLAVAECKNLNRTKVINFTNEQRKGNMNRGYCDFICSMERMKLKTNDNKLSKIEKTIYAKNLLKEIFKILDNKKLDNKLDNFAKLLTKNNKPIPNPFTQDR